MGALPPFFLPLLPASHMRKLNLIFLMLCAFSISWGQLSLDYDTLTYNDRFQGRLDSIDMNGCSLGSTFDGGLDLMSASELSVEGLFRAFTDRTLNYGQPFSQMEFSALPHLGFSYSIGGQTSQFLQAKYNQAFTDRTVLDLRYARSSGEGLIRNSSFTKNDLRIQFQHIGSIYSTRLNGKYLANKFAHPWGLSSDSLVGLFDLEFIPVVSSTANSQYKSGILEWSNYFDVMMDSTIAVGPMVYTQYGVYNRVYNQSGDLDALYSTINIDSLTTRDQFNVANIRNGLGAYFRTASILAQAHVDYNYWRYQNLGDEKDSNELFLSGMIAYAKKGLRIQDQFSINLQGRYGEIDNRLTAQYSIKKFRLSGAVNYIKKAPDYEQRSYMANGFAYQMDSPKLQQWLNGSLGVGVDLKREKYRFNLNAHFAQIKDVYAFNGEQWVIDSIQTTMASVEFASSMQFSVFHLQPRVQISYDKGGYLPLVSAYARAFVKGKLFKAKKLEALVGIDYSFVDNHEGRVYAPMMDTYNWFGSSSSFGAISNMHAFIALGIAEFRFFVRYENIGAFWWNENNSSVAGYPMPSTRLRLGLTWDFFN